MCVFSLTELPYSPVLTSFHAFCDLHRVWAQIRQGGLRPSSVCMLPLPAPMPSFHDVMAGLMVAPGSPAGIQQPTLTQDISQMIDEGQLDDDPPGSPAGIQQPSFTQVPSQLIDEGQLLRHKFVKRVGVVWPLWHTGATANLLCVVQVLADSLRGSSAKI